MFNNIKVDFNMGYIYLRKNKVNGKCYVGQTVDIKDRNRRWKKLNDRYGGYAINNARKKYGADGFSFELLKECPNEEMNYWEIYYIKMYNSKKPYGYNSTDGGDSSYERTEETRKKMSAALRGRKLSEETKAKMSAAQRGKKLSEETKAKIGAASKGRKHSLESIAKVVAVHKGRKHSPEHVAKVAAALNKAVQALDKDNGEVVKEFQSAKEAGRQGFDAGSICKCCRGKIKSHKGYIWRYKENAQE